MSDIFNPEKFKSITDVLYISSDMIFELLENYTLENYPEKDFKSEWGIDDLPRFIDSFYRFVYNKATVPTQVQFYNQYIIDNKKYFKANGFTETTMQGLKSRLFRTYSSLVRDFHFTFYLHDKGVKTVYNRTLDSKYGIDIMVCVDDKYFALSLFTNTARSLQAREGKKNVYPKFDNVVYDIECPLVFNESLHCGDFFLYGPNQYKTLMNIIMLKTEK